MSVDDARPDTSTPAPKPGIWARHKSRILGSILIAFLAIGVGVYRIVHLETGMNSAAVGSCASVEGTGKDAVYTPLDCADQKATLTVLAQLEDTEDCRTVAGFEQAIVDGKNAHLTCMGPKGVDPATSTNTAAVGECLTEEGDKRAPCNDPAAAYTILKRLDNVTEAAVKDTCTDVPEATDRFRDAYTSSKDSVATFGTSETTDYTVFCVAPVQR